MKGSEAHHVFEIMDKLVLLQNLQSLLNLLMQIKSLSKVVMISLVLEAMDRIVIGIFDVYGNILQRGC